MRDLQLLKFAVPLLAALACNDATSPPGLAGPETRVPQPTLVIPSTTPQVSAGAFYTCALKQDATVVCWGENGQGQATVPGGLASVAQVSAGGAHTCALKTDGTIVCWGRNIEGQATVPGGLASVAQVSAGAAHTCALKTDGTVVCWGDNSFGQTSVPGGLASVVQVSAGIFHTCALKTDGTVVCWGINTSGETTVPGGLTSVAQESAGGSHTCALKTDGTVVCWGSNSNGQVTVPGGLASVTQVSAGGDHTCALKTDGTVVCWGRNIEGQATVPAGLNLIFHGPLTAYPGTPVTGHIVLCKDASSPAGSYEFFIRSSGTIAGDVVQSSAFLSPGQCRIVFSRTAFSNITVTLTITEHTERFGATVQSITRTEFGITTVFSGASPTITVQANSSHGGVVTYKNEDPG